MILDYPDHTLLFPKKEETLTRCRFRPIPFRFPPFSFLIFSFSLITSYILLEIVFISMQFLLHLVDYFMKFLSCLFKV